MNRRQFFNAAALGGVSVGTLSSISLMADHHEGLPPKLLEWRRWHIGSLEKRGMVDRYLKEAAIPGLNRLGIKPVGVFYPKQDEGVDQDYSIYALVPFPSFEDYYNIRRVMGSDDTFLADASEYLGTPKGDPAFLRMESTLMRPFDGYPDVKKPREGERIFELRVYESHNEAKAALKVEMFNSGEFDIFNNVGLDSVFCGEALSGPGLPNLIYLVGYKDMKERKAAWGRFSKDPDWQVLRKNDRYKDTVSKIHQTFLVPASYSQI
jgi:hypothetical protein